MATVLPATLAQLSAQVRTQAAMAAYVDAFMLMLRLSLAAVPLIILLRRPGGQSASAGAAPAME